MRIKTILNRCYHLKSFVYEKVQFETVKGKETMVVNIVPRKNGLSTCSGCSKVCSVYDHSNRARLFDFVPLWGFAVCFRYVMRRVDCADCGVRVEQIPWAEGKNSVTKPYRLFLAHWARKLSWKEVAESFGTTWDCLLYTSPSPRDGLLSRMPSSA